MVIALTPLMTALGPFAVILLAAVIFAETGLLLGFFLPGDSLLFAAGVLVATGAIHLPLGVVVAAAAAAAVVGDQVGYLIGRRFGPRLFRQGRRFPHERHLEQARTFFDRHGHKAVVLARFVPLVRTLTPPVAGAASMPRSRFTAYNLLGGAAWTAAFLVGGFYLGGVPFVTAHVELLSVAMVACSLVPVAIAAVRRRNSSRRRPRPESAFADAVANQSGVRQQSCQRVSS